MHEDQPQSIDSLTVSPTDMQQLGEQLVTAVTEQEEGGLTDQSIDALTKEQQRTEDVLILLKQELKECSVSVPLVESALEDVFKRLREADDSADDIILTANVRQVRTRKRELIVNIAELEEKIAICEAHIENIRERILGLESRSDRIKRAMGHYAAFRAEIENMPKIEPVPSLYSELHKDQTVIAGTDVKEVTKILDKSNKATMSISVILPIESKQPSVNNSPESEKKRAIPTVLPIPGGDKSNKTFAKQRRSASNLIGNK